jgi:hypothetical protein
VPRGGWSVKWVRGRWCLELRQNPFESVPELSGEGALFLRPPIAPGKRPQEPVFLVHPLQLGIFPVGPDGAHHLVLGLRQFKLIID